MSPEERRKAAPPVLIQPGDLADLVVRMLTGDDLAGRVAVWPDGETWRLLPATSAWHAG
ncbi:hypothetical protein LIP_1060 [Limnochorda pilosa]|uniref:Uncharacterized protein n=1 Tax=Limnochorda pilosa TaxID=1555112 RepID=A0A0K2SIR5_LIMPI|nr:hypothetical protein LIP_1060 [Limnochorda pilosa]